jgi:hypothetical protein
VGEDSVLVHMVQRADAVEAQDRRDRCVFILEENELKSNLIYTTQKTKNLHAHGERILGARVSCRGSRTEIIMKM